MPDYQEILDSLRRTQGFFQFETKEYKVYSEYLDFYAATKNFYIVFTEPGEYTKLADLLGQDLQEKWDENLCTELKSTFFSFCRKCL